MADSVEYPKARIDSQRDDGSGSARSNSYFLVPLVEGMAETGGARPVRDERAKRADPLEYQRCRVSGACCGLSRWALRPTGNGPFEAAGQACRLRELTLPDDDGAPAKYLQARQSSLVPLPVVVKLALPEVLARLRLVRKAATRMAMPEAAMNEHSDLVAGENHIGLPWQSPIVKSEPVA
jgi:hypothetical protein